MITPSVFGAEQHVCKRSTLAVLTSRHGGKHMWQLYFATDLHRVRPWVNDINYDNGNEINKVCFEVCLVYSWSREYSSVQVFEILKIFWEFFFGNILYLYHTCTEEYKPSIMSKHTSKHTWKHTCKLQRRTFISVVIDTSIETYDIICKVTTCINKYTFTT